MLTYQGGGVAQLVDLWAARRTPRRSPLEGPSVGLPPRLVGIHRHRVGSPSGISREADPLRPGECVKSRVDATAIQWHLPCRKAYAIPGSANTYPTHDNTGRFKERFRCGARSGLDVRDLGVGSAPQASPGTSCQRSQGGRPFSVGRSAVEDGLVAEPSIDRAIGLAPVVHRSCLRSCPGESGVATQQ